jgi:hypothetical protein
LIDRLEGFAYTPKAIQQTLKLLNLVVYLIKTGSEEFAKDFKKNEDLIVSMERVDTHRYENCIGLKDAKTLTYKLNKSEQNHELATKSNRFKLQISKD